MLGFKLPNISLPFKYYKKIIESVSYKIYHAKYFVELAWEQNNALGDLHCPFNYIFCDIIPYIICCHISLPKYIAGQNNRVTSIFFLKHF